MKIIIATPLYPPENGGPAVYTVEIAERLKNAHSITVVAYADAAVPVPGVHLVTISKRQTLPKRLLKFSLALWRETKHADVIYVQNPVASGLPAMLIGKLRRIPVVLKLIGDEAWERATQRGETTKMLEPFLEAPEGSFYIRALMWLQGVVLRNVLCVTTPSDYLGKAVARAYGIVPECTRVNYNAAEDKRAQSEGIVPHQILATPRLVRWKGVDGIIRALKIVVQQFPDARLCIAGDGPELESLQMLAQELGVGGKVLFVGRVPHSEVLRLYRTSEVFVLNSTYEGLPHAVLDGFVTGTPVIATAISGTNEAVYDGKTGLLVPPNNPEALAQAIARLFSDKALADTLIEGGREILHKKFSWDSHLKVLLNIFESIISKD